MCKDHWFQVPAWLRTKIWGYYHNPETRGGGEHLAAIRKAIETVNAKQPEAAGKCK
jgi:hypothetical protein